MLGLVDCGTLSFPEHLRLSPKHSEKLVASPSAPKKGEIGVRVGARGMGWDFRPTLTLTMGRGPPLLNGLPTGVKVRYADSNYRGFLRAGDFFNYFFGAAGANNFLLTFFLRDFGSPLIPSHSGT